MDDYTETTPERMRELARQYLPTGQGLRVAVIPQGQQLATVAPPMPVRTSAASSTAASALAPDAR